MKIKLLILQTHPIQYYAPLYRRLAERGRIEILVVYLTAPGPTGQFDPGFGRRVKWDIDLLGGYRSRILKENVSITDLGFLGRYGRGLAQVFQGERPDWVYVYGYTHLANWRLTTLAKQSGARVMYSADSNARIGVTPVRRLLKALPVRLFLSRVNAFLYNAEANRDYLLSFGAPRSKMHHCPFCIDVRRFACNTDSVNGVRAVDFCWTGKLSPRKRVGDFLDALLLLRSAGLRFKAVIAGDGEDAALVRQKGAPLIAEDSLRYLGFLNQSEVPEVLWMSEVYVFTSEYDAYGLAVTEAAAAGCAVIASDICGCVGELGSAQPGRNALTYGPGDVEALAELMKTLLLDTGRRSRMQRESTVVASLHDLDVACECIEELASHE